MADNASHPTVHKFPRTKHIAAHGSGKSIGRDDLLMDKKEITPFVTKRVSIEEKVDGANLGISCTADYKLLFQNRSHFVTSASATQWKMLDDWVANHPGIWQVLTSPDIILFGEWLYAQHSILYTKLPDCFLAFDIYDKKTQTFLSRAERDAKLKDTGIRTVPLIAEGVFTKDQLLKFLDTNSQFHDGKIEGIYVRIDEEESLVSRGKIVNENFIQQIDEHWSKKSLVRNTVIHD